jgi:hypothetical protein
MEPPWSDWRDDIKALAEASHDRHAGQGVVVTVMLTAATIELSPSS